MKAQKLTKETIRDIGVMPINFPDFGIGDTVAVSYRIKEGNKERIQIFQGDVVAIHNNGVSSTFTVRKIGADAVGVERIFPYHSPNIESVKLVRRGDVRRAKLYYLRKRVGKAGRVKEKILTKAEKLRDKQQNNQAPAA